MKTLVLTFLSAIALASSAFNQAETRRPNATHEYPSTVPMAKPGIYTFGIFCGECEGTCAMMWRFNTLGDTNSLWVDRTDSYFKYQDEITCATNATSPERIALASRVVCLIPASLLESEETEQSFGCPDCADGCGIYLQIVTDGITRTFEIDYQTKLLNEEMASFVRCVKAPLLQLEKL